MPPLKFIWQRYASVFWAVALGVLVLSLSGIVFKATFKKEALVASDATLFAAVNGGVLLAQSNADRLKNGLSLLEENPLLTRAAQTKADDMLARGYYAHVTPEGRTPLYFVDQVGYKYLNLGENLDLTYLSTEEDVETAWMNSPEHRANLLLPQFTEVGVGISSGEYQGNQVTFAVEIYATPLPAATIKPKMPEPKPPTEPAVSILLKPQSKASIPIPSGETALSVFLKNANRAIASSTLSDKLPGSFVHSKTQVAAKSTPPVAISITPDSVIPSVVEDGVNAPSTNTSLDNGYTPLATIPTDRTFILRASSQTPLQLFFEAGLRALFNQLLTSFIK